MGRIDYWALSILEPHLVAFIILRSIILVVILVMIV